MEEGLNIELQPIQKIDNLQQLINRLLDRTSGVNEEELGQELNIDPINNLLESVRQKTVEGKREFVAPICVDPQEDNLLVTEVPIEGGRDHAIPDRLLGSVNQWASDKSLRVIGHIHSHQSEDFDQGTITGFSSGDLDTAYYNSNKTPVIMMVSPHYNYLVIPTEFTRMAESYSSKFYPKKYYSPGMEAQEGTFLKQQLEQFNTKLHKASTRRDFYWKETLDQLANLTRYGGVIYAAERGKPLQKLNFDRNIEAVLASPR